MRRLGELLLDLLTPTGYITHMPHTPRGCFGVLLDFIMGKQGAAHTAKLPAVQINKYFVSRAEADFFRVLIRVVGDRGHVLSQVSLRQLLWLPGNNNTNPGRATWQNKIAARSLDFLVCDPSTLRPLLAIELDEPSHARADRQTRDAEVEAILVAARLPIIHVLTSRTYDTRELDAAIAPYL